MSSPRALKAHKDAAFRVLKHIGPNESLEQLATRVASAVVEAEDRSQWVVIVDAGEPNPPWVYGPYASPEAARKSADSGLMLKGPRGAMLVAMRPVPRVGISTSRRK